MSANTVSNYSNTCSALGTVLQDLDVRIRVSEQNMKLRETYTEKIKTLENNVYLCKEVIDQMKPLLKDVQSYVAEKRQESMQNINNALRVAGEIIQDASEGIRFELDGDEAWLATADGMVVDAVEGGGYRQVSSAFLRSVVLNSNPNILHTLIFDEVFALVSPENSAVLSLYLDILTQDTQIISIEQKPQVYSNIDSIVYHFTKGEQFAEVHKEVVKNSMRSVERDGT